LVLRPAATDTMTRQVPGGAPFLSPAKREEIQIQVEEAERNAEAARQKGDTHQLLELLESGLYLKRHLYTEDSKQISDACRRLCEICNFAATALLQKGNLKGAHDLLKRAEEVAEKSDHDRAITWNNLACYYRRTNKLRTAVSYLERALAVEKHLHNGDAAQTHLNLCATLSQLQRHTEALQHAQSALIRVYETITPLMLRGELVFENAARLRDDQHEQITVLCIAYHNLAVEHEYMKDLEAATCAYSEGARWATTFLGAGHQLAGILRQSYESLRPKLPQTLKATQSSADIGQWPSAGSSRPGSRPGSRASSASRIRPLLPEASRFDATLPPKQGESTADPNLIKQKLLQAVTPRGEAPARQDILGISDEFEEDTTENDEQ